MIFVFSENSQQAHNWMRQKGASVANCVYIYRPDMLRGYRGGFYIRVGEPWKHEKAKEIEAMLKERGFIEVYVK